MARDPVAVKIIGIIANPAKEEAPAHALYLRDWLRSRGVEVLLHRELAARAGVDQGFSGGELARRSQLLAVFGGDGTMLRTARAARLSSTPIVGINLGGFGYLTEVNLGEMIEAFDVILRGDYQTERRMMLDVVLETRGGDRRERTVLNDAVINRGNLSRIIDLETTVDGRCLTNFKADGLIVATPTGSTAYSLSAGGPIVFPDHESIIVNPICPHTLTNRPVILPGRVEIGVVLRSRGEGATLTLDGQVSFDMRDMDKIYIRKSSYYTTLVCSPHRDYLEILRSKLGWGGVAPGLEGA